MLTLAALGALGALPALGGAVAALGETLRPVLLSLRVELASLVHTSARSLYC